MAIVADQSGQYPASLPSGVDKKLSSVNRNIAVSPFGVETPQYTGEIVQDYTTAQLWMASDLTTFGWIAVTMVI